MRSTPNVLYEGVLDIVDDSYRSHSLGIQCIIHNTIIGNNLNSTPLIETIGSKYSVIYKYKISYILEHCCNFKTFRSTARHYFGLSFIGRSQTINCSFTSDTVQSTEIHSDEGILDSVLGKTIKFKITETTDTIHNKEYACIGVASDGNDFFTNVTIVALSKL